MRVLSCSSRNRNCRKLWANVVHAVTESSVLIS